MGWFNHQLVIDYPQNTHEHPHHHTRLGKDLSHLPRWVADALQSQAVASRVQAAAWLHGFFYWKPMGLEKKNLHHTFKPNVRSIFHTISAGWNLFKQLGKVDISMHPCLPWLASNEKCIGRPWDPKDWSYELEGIGMIVTWVKIFWFLRKKGGEHTSVKSRFW